jgi:hypothetical protein
MRGIIPPRVFDSVQQHLRSAGESSVSGWEDNKEEEDSLTGDLGHHICTRRHILVNVDGQVWRWRVSYKKFRGRGRGAYESKSGADGIIQVEAALRDETFFKGVLFQAKKGGEFRTTELTKQVEAIEKIAPGGSAIILYRPTSYVAVKGTEFLHPGEGLVGPVIKRMRPLGSFFDEFLECKNGLRGMYYEAVRERLVLPTIDGQIKAVELDVRHRIKIEIASS